MPSIHFEIKYFLDTWWCSLYADVGLRPNVSSKGIRDVSRNSVLVLVAYEAEWSAWDSC